MAVNDNVLPRILQNKLRENPCLENLPESQSLNWQTKYYSIRFESAIQFQLIFYSKCIDTHGRLTPYDFNWFGFGHKLVYLIMSEKCMMIGGEARSQYIHCNGLGKPMAEATSAMQCYMKLPSPRVNVKRYHWKHQKRFMQLLLGATSSIASPQCCHNGSNSGDTLSITEYANRTNMGVRNFRQVLEK